MDSLDARRCAKCKITFSPIAEHFYPNKAQARGWDSYCKTCKSAATKQSRASQPDEIKLKERMRGRLTMQRSRAKHPEKAKATRARYYLKHRDEILERDAKYRAINSSAHCAAARKYHQQHKDEQNARRRRHYLSTNGAATARARRHSDPEHFSTLRKRYRKANLEKLRFSEKCKLANRRKAVGMFTVADLKEQYRKQAGLCFWCHLEVFNDFHVDHVVPLSRGGTNRPDNIVISCPRCNCRKHNMMPDDWLKRLREQC